MTQCGAHPQRKFSARSLKLQVFPCSDHSLQQSRFFKIFLQCRRKLHHESGSLSAVWGDERRIDCKIFPRRWHVPPCGRFHLKVSFEKRSRPSALPDPEVVVCFGCTTSGLRKAKPTRQSPTFSSRLFLSPLFEKESLTDQITNDAQLLRKKNRGESQKIL